MGTVYVGIGGWNFAPWRGTFYPPGLKQADELAHASRQVTSIEINATFYATQTPDRFARWRHTAPQGFIFSVKAPRVATHRRDLADAAPSIERFLGSGITALGPALGALLWQFPPTRRFDRAAMETFLTMLPAERDGVALRHVIEARHPSFADADWIALLRTHGVAQAIVESDKHTLLGDLTAGFAYARLERNAADAPEGYDAAALDRWAARARAWSAGEAVTDMPFADPAPITSQARDCFIYFISGDKQRAPDAARAFLRRFK